MEFYTIIHAVGITEFKNKVIVQLHSIFKRPVIPRGCKLFIYCWKSTRVEFKFFIKIISILE